MDKVNRLSPMNYCVLIPTYNNDKTLENVILSVFPYTQNVIVVNDGSTDETGHILERYRNQIEIVSYHQNRGKGAALKKGFKRAEALGYRYVITLDADGQHLAAEIPKFLEKVASGSDILVIGNRDMAQDNIPAKSKFGRKFSNFWVRLETNRDIMDTQSGYRLYTANIMNRFHFFTNRYDFELESLVRWLWAGYPVEIINIDVYYPPPEERVSHFKVFKDNLRISLLNVMLVLVTIIYIIPKRVLRFIKENCKKLLRLAAFFVHS